MHGVHICPCWLSGCQRLANLGLIGNPAMGSQRKAAKAQALLVNGAEQRNRTSEAASGKVLQAANHNSSSFGLEFHTSTPQQRHSAPNASHDGGE